MKPIVITIDGPSGSGKGTTALRVARRLGLVHVDSGSLYRAVALTLHEQNISPDESVKISQALPNMDISFNANNEIMIDGVNRESDIRTRENSKRVFAYSRDLQIRAYVTELQRGLLVNGGVLDGRDAGSVVAPDADLKIYLDCDIDIRTYRRAKQHGITEPLEIAEIKKEIQERDAVDMNKGKFSLQVLPESVIVDTSDMTIDEQVDAIYQLAQEKTIDA